MTQMENLHVHVPNTCIAQLVLDVFMSDLCKELLVPNIIIIVIFTSGPTPQVASLAVHMSARANKEIKKKKKKEKKNQKKKQKKTSSGIRTQVVMFTDSVSNHSSMGARSHRTD